MVVQDDSRESQLIEIFRLAPSGEGRSGTDALLNYRDQNYKFELKSTTTSSVTTVRDFGPEHAARWRGKHWIVGIYDKQQNLKECKYGTPELMEKWAQEKLDYMKPDLLLIKNVKNAISEKVLYEILGKKEKYTLDDAKKISKKQLKNEDYISRMDLGEYYSSGRILEMLKERAVYLVSRGATLNNPHIEKKTLDEFKVITDNHAENLRRHLDIWSENPYA